MTSENVKFYARESEFVWLWIKEDDIEYMFKISDIKYICKDGNYVTITVGTKTVAIKMQNEEEVEEIVDGVGRGTA